MPCQIAILTLEGLQPAPYTADSLADAAQHEPHDGVYTITNTYPGLRVLKMTAHLDRLEDSARRAGIDLTLERDQLRIALREMIRAASWYQEEWGQVRFRITVPKTQPDHLILSVEPFKPLPEETYTRGVWVVTVRDVARQNLAAKTTDWMQDRAAIERDLPADVFTGILVDADGQLLEGLSSNFYAVLDGELRTAGGGVLPGIAQQVVFEIAPNVLPVRREAPTMSDLPRISEAFITSASRGIVPVVQIDKTVLGDGTPGDIVKRLQLRYNIWVDGHLEPLDPRPFQGDLLPVEVPGKGYVRWR